MLDVAEPIVQKSTDFKQLLLQVLKPTAQSLGNITAGLRDDSLKMFHIRIWWHLIHFSW